MGIYLYAPKKASLKNFRDLPLLSDYWPSISTYKISGLTLNFGNAQYVEDTALCTVVNQCNKCQNRGIRKVGVH